tara:strand:+ start:483 stop:998 length:516 start_codon:yes stop_codon:yes gene_type:complete
MGLCHSKVHVRSDTYTDIEHKDSKSNKKYNKRYDLFKNLNEKIKEVIKLVSNDKLENLVLAQTNPKIERIKIHKYFNDDIRGIVFTLEDDTVLEIYMSSITIFKGEISVLKISYNGNTLFFPQTAMSLYNFTSSDNNLILIDETMSEDELEYFVHYITGIYMPILMNILTD